MNWFERHLNWSLFFGTSLLPFGVGLIFTAIFAAIFWGQLAPYTESGMEGLSEDVFNSIVLKSLPLDIISGLISLAVWIFGLIVMWWYLGQKARSKWFMLLYFVPMALATIYRATYSRTDPSSAFFSLIFGLFMVIVGLVDMIIFYCLENHRIGYGGDFAAEPVADQRADTRQYGTPDDWRPKELDYSPAKDARYIAYGGDVKGVRDVGVPSGEIPAKPPAEVQEKAVENVPADAPAADAQEKAASEAPEEAIGQSPVEAMEKTPEETTAEAMGELPIEAPAAAAEVREKAPEEAIGQSPAEALEEIPEEIPAEVMEKAPEEAIGQSLTEAIEEVLEETPAETAAAAQVIETTSSQPMSQVPILLDDAGAVLKCFYHPDADSVNLCSRCGHYVCSECNYVTGTHPICRNCWDRRDEVPISPAPVKKQESPKVEKSDKRKIEKDERSREFMLLYEQAAPVINTVIKKGPDGLPASPLDLMEGLKLRPMLEYAKKLPKPQGKEWQEAKKEFEQLLVACIKVAETAADFVSSGGQAIPVEADYARLADGIEKASVLMGGLYQRMGSLPQPQE